MKNGSPAKGGVDVLFSPVGGFSESQKWTNPEGAFVETTYGAVAYLVWSEVATYETSNSQTPRRVLKYMSDRLEIQPTDLEKPIRLVLHKAQR